MVSRKWTIAIRPNAGETPRKITKIIGLNGRGFSVLAPYHKARSGYLGKMPAGPHVQGESQKRWDDCISFTAEDRVKLSYHADGFAQFSSETAGKIISGRDPTTGQPKGLGLMTRPFEKPIWSGGSVGIMVWGIHDFVEAKESDSDLVTFEPKDFYYRGCTPGDANAWYLQIYVFPTEVTPPVRYENEQQILTAAIEGINGPLASVVRFKTLHLTAESVFLGLYVSRCVVGFPAASGWTINGPGDYTAEKPGHALMAIYPRPGIPVEGLDSLDRNVS
jgi:hypothetical protein